MVTHAVKTISAARHGDVEGLRRLNMSGVDVDAKDSLGWSALHRASMHGQLDAMRVLVLECGAAVDNVDEDGWTAAHRAAWSGQLESLRCLVLELGADPIAGCAAHGESAIHVATRNGQIDALRCLVTELGVDVETADKWGRTAVHFAAWEGRVDVLVSLKMLGNLKRDGHDMLAARDIDGKFPVARRGVRERRERRLRDDASDVRRTTPTTRSSTRRPSGCGPTRASPRRCSRGGGRRPRRTRRCWPTARRRRATSATARPSSTRCRRRRRPGTRR